GGIAVDGVFGAKTEQKVRAFQKANGLAVDGIVGRNTWGKLF
ncbi:peptidoglycan-binding protein, partial [Hazenella sp. IB182357]